MERKRRIGGYSCQNLWVTILLKLATFVANRREMALLAFGGFVFLCCRSTILYGSYSAIGESGAQEKWWWESPPATTSTGGEMIQPMSADMTIIILSMDRFESLQRLVKSLQLSKYPNKDKIDLTIRFDRPPAHSARPNRCLQGGSTTEIGIVRQPL